MSATNYFASVGAALTAALEEGATVSIDERAHDLIDRGYAATFPAIPTSSKITLHLRRVETHYEWRFDAHLHVASMSFDQAEDAGLDGTLRS